MRTILAAGLTAWVSASAGHAVPISDTYSGAVFFGDSLTDTGNLGAFAPPPPYFAGQFSNGPVWADRVDDAFAPLATRNYALGGAETDGTVPPGLDGQIDALSFDLIGGLATGPLSLGARPLASVWMGANNLFEALDEFGTGLVLNDPTAEAAADQVATDAAADIGMGLQRLIDEFDIRDLLVFTLPDLGQTPGVGANPLIVGDARDLTETFNAALVSELGGLTGPGIDVTLIDVFEIFDDVVAGDALPQLTNTSDACFDGGAVCAAPDTHLFWDAVHPTAVAHADLAQRVEQALAPVPAPPALPLLAAGVLVLGWAARRPRA